MPLKLRCGLDHLNPHHFGFLAFTLAVVLVFLSYVLFTLNVWTFALILVSGGCWYLSDEGGVPLRRNKFKVCVVGAGFSGICMAIKLKQAKIPFVLLENYQSTKWVALGTKTSTQGWPSSVFSLNYQFSFFMSHKWSSALSKNTPHHGPHSGNDCHRDQSRSGDNATTIPNSPIRPRPTIQSDASAFKSLTTTGPRLPIIRKKYASSRGTQSGFGRLRHGF